MFVYHMPCHAHTMLYSVWMWDAQVMSARPDRLQASYYGLISQVGMTLVLRVS